jgi:GT2 family glycosyltransferase
MIDPNELIKYFYGIKENKLLISYLLDKYSTDTLYTNSPGSTISIIIPCYGQSQYLVNLVSELLLQTKLPDKILILLMDRDSQDLFNKLSIMSNRVYCYCTDRLYLCDARNYLISKVDTDYFIPLDADDKLDKRYIETVCKYLDYDIIITNKYIEYDNKLTEYPIFEDINLFNIPLFQTTSLINTTFFRSIGFYDPEFNSGNEDTEFYLRSILNGAKIKCIDEKLFIYHMNTDPNTSYRIYAEKNSGHLHVVKKYKDMYIDYLNALHTLTNDSKYLEWIKIIEE